MTKSLTDKERNWYYDALDALGGAAVVGNREANTVTYNGAIASDESHVKSGDPEGLFRSRTNRPVGARPERGTGRQITNKARGQLHDWGQAQPLLPNPSSMRVHTFL